MMFGSDISRIMDTKGSLVPFGDTVQILKEADITFGVLEGGIGTRGEPSQDKEYTFRSRPSAARGLANAGFDIVSLANPHIMDYGEKGLLDTLEFLSWYSVRYVGAGVDLQNARKPVLMETDKLKVAFIAYYRGSEFDPIFAREAKPGPAFPAYDEIDQDIAKAKTQADVVIVSVYWGYETQDGSITSRQKLYAHKFVDSGADAVLGQRLHTLQGIEIYKGKPIIHSLGDFIYGTYAKKIPIGFIIRLVFVDKNVKRLEIIPVSTSDAKTNSYFPEILYGEESQNAIKALTDLSQEFGTDIRMEENVGIVNIINR
jgi:poly-gamma-glutamate synthesis protein (capsule biosynthesis protein)